MTSSGNIIVVSGLPRSGTSLMMQMLHKGGVEVVTDQIRTPDVDNPRGYFELEAVKDIGHDASWLPETRGKAFKMISLLLYQLPSTERYRILFMERDLDEILQSQETMLRNRNAECRPRHEMRKAFRIHLERLHDWLTTRPEMQVCRFGYKELLSDPERQSQRIAVFLDRPMNIAEMVQAVDQNLYRSTGSEGTEIPSSPG